MGTVNVADHAFLARLTQLDYARAMAFAALDPGSGDLLGVVRLHSDADHRQAEFALLVRSDLKSRGLGRALLTLGLEWARSERLARVHGLVLADNAPMLGLCRELGFALADGPDESLVQVALDLDGARPGGG